MKYEDGSDMLKISSEYEYPTDCEGVIICDGEIYINDYLYHSDPYDGNMVSISIEDWEEVKKFVDSQINKEK